jgi:hypothetical protein
VQPPPPVVAPALRDVIQAVADAFNEVLGHREDDQIPVDDGSDSGDEVEECQRRSRRLPMLPPQGRDGLRSFALLTDVVQA